MRTRAFHLAINLGIAVLLAAGYAISLGQETAKQGPAIPSIQLENVPLIDGIKNLARQAKLNYILDPRFDSLSVDPVGKVFRERTVTFTWEQLTAQQALDRLLKENGLTLVENQATTVVRITSTNWPARAGVSPDQFAGRKNDVIPLLVMDNVPLGHGLKNLARQAELEVAIDEKLSESYYDTAAKRFVQAPTVSIRWETMTSSQAIAALVENYDLDVAKDAATSAWRISPKAKPNTK